MTQAATTQQSTREPVGLRPSTLLVVAAVAVGFAAADTYVVVLALPDMMSSAGLAVDELQRAAPIVSGFLLGYVAMLPLIGRLADVRGRVPVLVGSLVIFSIGSLVTAASYDLATMVVGRFLQGVGGGGLVPATLALVADIWVAERRGVPLGVVGAVQELGSVLGPLFGALVLARASWPVIFWINLVVGLTLAGALLLLSRGSKRSATVTAATTRQRGSHDIFGALFGAAALAALALVMSPPDQLTRGLTTGLAYVPYVSNTRWSTPMAMALYLLIAAFLIRELTALRPLLRLRELRELGSAADLPGAALLGLSLAGIVLAFATADPEVEVFSDSGPALLIASAVCALLFAWRQQRAATPLIPAGALSGRAAWGSMLVSFFVGAALIAALVDIPIFARITVYPNSQLGAALVLVRLLAALPVGALAGGYLIRRLPTGFLAAGGMLLAAAGFGWMAQWGQDSLGGAWATAPLVLCGFGFGLAIAPVNSALLAATRNEVHGVSSALIVVTRMIGMLVGISALTTLGLRRFYAVSADIPPVTQVCDSNEVCDRYVSLLTDAGIAQLHAIFWGAAVCAAFAAVLCLALLRGSATDSTTGRFGGIGVR
ncbi:MAG: MFS transporter [Nocardioidaceae bacterium]